MSDLYKSLCLELDLLLVAIIDAMEKHVASKLDLEKSMNDGFVNIAKTRYINGQRSVTSLQLPTELSSPIQPQVQVIRSTNSIQVENNLSAVRKANTEKDGLRKRQGVTEEDKNEKSNDQKSNDPIRLFGVLVPQSLKNAQKSFITSVDKIASVALTEMELDKKLSRYEKLLKIKKQLS